MASAFPLQIASKLENSEPMLFDVKSAETFTYGELVFFNTTGDKIEVCGADPSLILGIAMGPATVGLDANGSIYGGTKLPVQVLSPNTICFMASATTPVAADLTRAYGVVKTGNNWLVDTSDTSNTRVVVVGISNTPQQEGYYVRFLAANLMLDAIAS